jgi:hypothetical protein
VISLKDVRAEDVARHQVGRELDAIELQVEQTAERLDQRRFPDPWQTFEQNVSPAKNAREYKTMKFRPAKEDAVQFGQCPFRKLDRRSDFFGLQDCFCHIFLSDIFLSDIFYYLASD